MLHGVFNSEGPQRLFRSRDLSELLRTTQIRGTAFKLVDSLSPPQGSAFEAALGRIASGDFELSLTYWVGGQEHMGDVVSIELESDTGAAREGSLPGAGDRGGLVRLGRRVLASLASGQPISMPSGQWQQPSFEPPVKAPARQEHAPHAPPPEPPGGATPSTPSDTARDVGSMPRAGALEAAERQLRGRPTRWRSLPCTLILPSSSTGSSSSVQLDSLKWARL